LIEKKRLGCYLVGSNENPETKPHAQH
jgi:hypothetical protein